MTSSDRSPVDYRVGLAHRLRELMRRRDVTKADIQTTLGCSESKVGKILRGDHSIAPLELVALLDLLGVAEEERADLVHLGEEARRRRPKTPWGSAIPDRLRKFFNTEETARRIEACRRTGAGVHACCSEGVPEGTAAQLASSLRRSSVGEPTRAV
ncbi:helix-turn-helix domain-containing protein [Actinosynnema sp. CA-299493]